MEEEEAIDAYNAAGDAAVRGGFFAGVRWPHLPLDPGNLQRLAEGVLAVRLDVPRVAFGSDFDGAACGDRLEEAWRSDALQVRFAPEGVFVRAAFTVRVTLAEIDDAGLVTSDVAAEETLTLTAEFCVSFVEQRHTRPFIDFMSGEVRRAGDDSVRSLDPFSFRVDPVQAVAWGLNAQGD